jgi:hypothetical protein
MIFACLFVYDPHEQVFNKLAAVTITGDITSNLDLCVELMGFSSEGSFTFHNYCNTGP